MTASCGYLRLAPYPISGGVLLESRCLPAIRRRNNARSIGYLTDMGRQVTSVIYVVAMAAVIVGLDFAFFRNRIWERLIVNIGVVLVFAAFYLRFLRRP
jgi:hypothetical protein